MRACAPRAHKRLNPQWRANLAGEVAVAHVLEQLVGAVQVERAELAARVLARHVRLLLRPRARLQLQREAQPRLRQDTPLVTLQTLKP